MSAKSAIPLAVSGSTTSITRLLATALLAAGFCSASIAMHAGSSKPSLVRVRLSDGLLVLSGLVLAWHWIRSRRSSPPTGSQPFPDAIKMALLAPLPSLASTDHLLSFAKDYVQWLLYFGVAFRLFQVSLTETTTRRFLVIISVVLGIAAVAGAGERVFVGDVLCRSVFVSRNELLCFLILATPYVYEALSHAAGIRRFVAVAGLLAVAGCITTPWSGAILGAQMLYLACLRTGRLRALGLTLCLLYLTCAAVIANPPRSWLFEHRERNAYDRDLASRAATTVEFPLWEGDFGTRHIRLTTAMLPVSLQASDTPQILAEMKASWFRREIIDAPTGLVPRQALVEAAGAVALFLDHPVIGAGLGNYQAEIGSATPGLLQSNTILPDSQSGLLILLATTGLFGFTSFLTAVLAALRVGGNATSRAAKCSVVSLTIATLFSPVLFSGGIGPFMAFSWAMLHTNSQPGDASKPSKR